MKSFLILVIGIIIGSAGTFFVLIPSSNNNIVKEERKTPILNNTYERKGILIHFNKEKSLMYIGNTWGFGNRLFRLAKYTVDSVSGEIKLDKKLGRSAQQILEANFRGLWDFRFKLETKSILMEGFGVNDQWEKKYFDPIPPNREGYVYVN